MHRARCVVINSFARAHKGARTFLLVRLLASKSTIALSRVRLRVEKDLELWVV